VVIYKIYGTVTADVLHKRKYESIISVMRSRGVSDFNALPQEI
jgi:hypothetical protein